MLFNQACAFVDIETTGGSAKTHGITEIALATYHPSGDKFEWQSLINPGQSISGFIQQLTGISDAMVDHQPYFNEMAAELYERLSDVVFIAHNARFDYGFLKAAFASSGFRFNPQVICTVKLARALYPELGSHSLDALCRFIRYQRKTAHRAMADVHAMCAFVRYAIEDKGIEQVNAMAQLQLKRPSQPIYLAIELIDEIPDSPGVYRFYGEERRLLYIGKSVRMRERVKSHFSADITHSKERLLSSEVRDIDWTETVGELGALLLENQEIKAKSPIYNRRQRRYSQFWSFQLPLNSEKVLVPTLVCRKSAVEKGDEESRLQWYGFYPSKAKANQWLLDLIKQEQLCKKLLGLEQATSTCFNYQIKQCRGGCVGGESVAQHNLRVLTLFDKSKVDQWPFSGPAVIAESAEYLAEDELGAFELQEAPIASCAFHVLDNWTYLGSVRRRQDIQALIENAEVGLFDRDTYRIINKYIHQANLIEQASDEIFNHPLESDVAVDNDGVDWVEEGINLV